MSDATNDRLEEESEGPLLEKLSAKQTNTLRELLEHPLQVRSIAFTVLAVLATLYSIWIAQPVLITIVFAWLLKTVLAPPVRMLRGARLPASLAATIVILVICGGIGFGVDALSGPAREWTKELPGSIDRIAEKFGKMKGPLDDVTQVTKQVEELSVAEEDLNPVSVKLADRTTLAERLFSEARLFLLNLVILIVLVYFMLATDEAFLTKVVEILPRLRDKKMVVGTIHKIEEHVSRYMLTVTAINIGLAVSVTVAMWFWNMPNPLLWGVMAGIVNYVPYLGPTVGVSIVAGVSLLTFEEIGHILGPPLTYLVLNGIEGLLVTPAVLGRSFALSPVVILIWLLLWSWIWGVPGALLAVPLLAAFKIVCDNVPSLNPIGRLLSR